MAKKIKGSWKFEPFEKFGEWTVLSNDRKKIKNNYYVKCKCDCGTVDWVRVDRLISGASTRCRKNLLYHSNLLDESKKLIGKKVGKLKIIDIDHYEIDQKKNYHKIYYKCLCDCGNETIVMKNDLVRANPTKSCGCEQVTNKNDKLFKKQGGDFNTRLPLAERTKANKGNKLKERNIYKKGNYYKVTFIFKKQIVYSEYFKELEEAIEARNEFRDNELKTMIDEVKEKLKD